MPIQFKALPTDAVRAVQAGGPDAYGLRPERRVSDGSGVPCRHCLRLVASGQPYLVLAWRPFPSLQPYAETGPIFLHAEECPPAAPGPDLPEILDSPDYILRGYCENDRIVYGTGAVVPTGRILPHAQHLLGRNGVAYVHVRSARNNCYQLRIDGG
jgi:hypothetical protein